MSTRYIKKVFGDDTQQAESEIETDIQVGNEGKKLFNVYDLLNDNSEKEVEDESSEKEDPEESVQVSKVKSKGKKKRHKKQHQQQQQNVESDPEESLDEIDRTVRQINRLLGEPATNSSQQVEECGQSKNFVSKSKEQILCVIHKNLNPYNELKRIFGSKTVQGEQKPRNRGRTGHLKKTWLVSSRDGTLPVTKSGLSMSIDKTMNVEDVKYFVYEHSQSYKQIQEKFILAVESLNPENIINIVNEYPFHVDSLLQSAELCTMGEELAMAAQLIEQALFYLEYAFHPLFNMTTAKCRLDYRKQNNRALFITLFKHLILVGGRACYRTSLELCKLLLSLDPDGDPLAVVLMIDFYAIRAKEYSWFIEFCSLWENARNLTQLPNIAYSLALAHFHLGNRKEADELLQNALIMFPGALIPLLEKCSIQPDTTVLLSEYFTAKAVESTPPALETLQKLFIARNFYLWKEADILPWLESQVKATLQRIDAKDDYVKFCHVKRSRRYLGKLPKNIARHIISADMKDVAINLQEVVRSERSILSHDPLPPADSINSYSNPSARTRTNQSTSNLISLFVSSIFDMERFRERQGPNGENQDP